MATLSEQVIEIEQKIKALEFQLAVEREVLARLKAVNPGPAISAHGHGRFIGGSVASAMAEMLRESDEAMTVDEIVKGLESRGFSTTAKAGLRGAVFSVISKQNKLFVKVDRGLYSIVRQGAAPEAVTEHS